MTRALVGGTAAALLLLGAGRIDPRLAWLVCAPLVAASSGGGRPWGRAAVLGVTFALEVTILGHAGWLAEAAQRYFGLPPAAARSVALLMCVGCAVPMGVLLGLALACAGARPGAWPIVSSAAVWVAWENLTRIAFPYYPWIGLAATQVEVPTVLQAASLAGQAGLSLVLATVGSAVAYAVRTPAPQGVGTARSPRVRWTAIGLASTIAVATPLYGAVRLRSAASPTTPLCSVAAVDASITDPGAPLVQVLERYTRASEPATTLRPDAIVWPESALPLDPLLDSELLRDLRALSRTWQTVIFAGGPRFDWGPDWGQRRFNSVFRIAGGDPVEVYDKRALVPFAESWPTPLIAKPGWLDVDEVTPGEHAELMRVGACRIGLLVCFEAERPALARDLAAGGADAIVIASNDAELPMRAVESEVAEARLRALETGLPVLRTANAGMSIVIDRYGREIDSRAAGIVVLRAAAADLAPAVHLERPLLALCWLGAVLVVASSCLPRRSR